MSWKSPIPTRSLLLLSFLLVLSGPALEGCQSASVGDTSGAKPPEAAEEHEMKRAMDRKAHQTDTLRQVGERDRTMRRDLQDKMF